MRPTALLALALAAALLAPALAQEATVEEVAKELVCQCGCGIILSECEANMQCDVAKAMKAELEAMITRELTEDEIIKEMQARYGVGVVATPPKTVPTLISLWLYPLFGVAAGAAVIYFVAKRKSGKWYVSPDEVPELSEEKVAELWGAEAAKLSEEVDIISKYEALLEERKRERSG